MNLFERKTFTMHSGAQSDFKIECDSLTDEDLETIALLISKKYKFSAVHGVPAGGKRLEKALVKYVFFDSHFPCLIVDDVLTTGNSMEEFKDKCHEKDVLGVVIFARGECPDWVTPIFKMWSE